MKQENNKFSITVATIIVMAVFAFYFYHYVMLSFTIDNLYSENSQVRDQAKTQISGMIVPNISDLPPRVIEHLLISINDKNPQIRRLTAKYMSIWFRPWHADQFPNMIPSLVFALQDDDQQVKASVARTLGHLNAEEAITMLCSVFYEKNKDVQQQVIYALTSMKRLPDATPVYIAAFQNKQLNLITRQLAIRNLAFTAIGNKINDLRNITTTKTESEFLVPVFIKAREDSNARIRFHAIQGLGYCPDPRSVDALVKALYDLDYKTRRMALVALGRIGTKKGKSVLRQALNDSVIQKIGLDILNSGPDLRASVPFLIETIDQKTYSGSKK